MKTRYVTDVNFFLKLYFKDDGAARRGKGKALPRPALGEDPELDEPGSKTHGVVVAVGGYT